MGMAWFTGTLEESLKLRVAVVFFAARFGALALSCDGKLGCLRLVS